MGRSKETFGKKEVRNKKEKKRKEKEKRRLERKEQGKKASFDDMIAWVDENGNIIDTPPDTTEKEEIEVENIEVSVPKAESRINSKIRTGLLKNYDEEKAYGFIIDDKTRESVFVHKNDCLEAIKAGIQVEYEIEKGLKGLKAINVKPLS
jgi:cold shock CspA family protein